MAGVRGTGKNIVTKHDPEISSRRNAANAMDKFSLNLDTGKYGMVYLYISYVAN